MHLRYFPMLLGLLIYPRVFASGPEPAGKYLVTPVVKSVRESFPLSAVRLLEGPFKAAKERDLRYLLSNDPDRLLHWHRKAAGLPPKADHYGGWEDGGSNILGHYLTACALMYATTDDARLLKRVNYLVDELETCQNSRSDGGLFNYPDMVRNFDQMRNGQMVYKLAGPEFPFVNGGNPFYGLHKAFAGLRDAYLYCNNEKAKRVMIRFADWVDDFVAQVPEDKFQELLDVEHGGMAEVMADLYAMTGDKKYFRLARKFVHQRMARPVAEGLDVLYPHHANNQIPKFVGYERMYQLAGDQAAMEGQAAQNFWDIVQRNHTLVIGGNSEYERFGPAGQLSQRIGYSSAETCNTYNLLKLSNQLYQRTGEAKYMAYYERALLNHILASIGPEEGQFCYYVNLKPGRFKTFSTPFNSGWCCVGSGMENPGKYEEAIYAHDDKNLFVNLFMPSRVQWEGQHFALQQETRFPESETVLLRITQPGNGSTGLRIRQPGWVSGKMGIWINNKPYETAPATDGYVAVNHAWKKGDVVKVVFPMQLHLETTPDNPNIAAVLYGPVVLAGELGRKDLEKVSFTIEGDMFKNEGAPDLAQIPVFVVDTQRPDRWIKPVAGKPLTFEASTPEARVTLRPFYAIHDQRYAVYWDVFSPAGWQTYAQARQAAVLDRVVVEDAEGEKAHGLKGEKMRTDTTFSRTLRTASDGGWFSYELEAGRTEPLFLVCQYWGGGWGPDPAGVMDILVENTKVGTRNFAQKDHETLFFDAVYAIPPQLTRDREKVTVRFQLRPGAVSSGLFACKLVTAEGLAIQELLRERQ